MTERETSGFAGVEISSDMKRWSRVSGSHRHANEVNFHNYQQLNVTFFRFTTSNFHCVMNIGNFVDAYAETVAYFQNSP
jgi:hypothetical protein